LFILPDSNFHLQAGSSCIKTGLSVGFDLDYDGVAVSDPPNIGVYDTDPYNTLTTLATLTTRLLLMLGDTSANRFTVDITTEAFRLALAEYSYGVPYIKTETFTVTVAGREQTLTSLARLIAVTMVLFPWTDDTVEIDPLDMFYYYFTDGVPVVYIGGQRVPAVGDKLRITYALTHVIDDLDTAATCTVPPQDFALLLQGAAGHAARLRTAIYSESFSAHPELKLFAVDNLAQFRATLSQRRRASSRQPLPAVGFKLDQWDGT
jgi:hypothetical protein